MELHLVLTNKLSRTKPDSCKIINEFGRLIVKFEHGTECGLHCIVGDLKENLDEWLSNHKQIIIGVDNPKNETFRILKIN